MKKLLLLLALTSLMIGSQAFAILDDGQNSLGVYFDAGTFEVNCYDPIPNVPFSMFFVLANCTEDIIGGFEFAWEFDPDPAGTYFTLGTILPPNALNIGDNNNFIVGIGSPYETNEATVLVEMQILFVVPPAEAFVTVGPSTPASIPGSAAFVSGESVLFSMRYSTVDGVNVIVDEMGWVRPGLGRIPCPGPIATEKASWGNVKALYK